MDNLWFLCLASFTQCNYFKLHPCKLYFNNSGVGVLCKKVDFPYMYMGFRGLGWFHSVALPSHKILETSAFSHNGEEVMEKEHVLLRIKNLVAEGTVITWAHIPLVGTSHGSPT